MTNSRRTAAPHGDAPRRARRTSASLALGAVLASAFGIAGAAPASAADLACPSAPVSPTSPWQRVYRNDFPTLTDVNVFNSSADANALIRPDDTSNSALQKPTVRGDVVVSPDAQTADGSAVVAYTRVAPYTTPTGTSVGWTNGRWSLKGQDQAPPVRVRARVKLTPSAYTKTAVMWWPSGGGWPWEVDFAETFGGTSLTDYWGGRQNVSQRWHGDVNGDGQASEQLVKNLPMDGTQYHVYEVTITPQRMSVQIDGVEKFATTDPNFIPKGNGFLSVGKAMEGRRDTVGRTDDAVSMDWVEIDKPAPGTPPTVATSVSATADDATQSATLAWAPPTDGSPVTGYRVSRDGTDAAGTGPVTLDVPAGQCSVTFGGLRPGGSYALSVQPLSAVGPGPVASDTVRVAPVLPGAPAGVTVTAADPRTATVGWSAPADDGGSAVTGYVVTRTGPDGAVTTPVAAEARSATLAGLTPGSSYDVSVRAVTAAGTGPAATGTVQQPATTAGAPTATAAQDDVARTATLTWSAPAFDGGSPVTGYRVSRDGTDASGFGAWSTVLPATATSQTFRNLQAGGAYHLTVAAINALGTGAADTEGVQLVNLPASAPTAVTATAGNASAVVSWAAPASAGSSPVTGYVVRRYAGTGTAPQASTTVAASARSLSVPGLVNGTGYAFDVAAVTSAGTGTVSTRTASVTPATVPSAPTAPTALSGTSGGSITAGVSWTAPADGGAPITGYRVTALRVSSTGAVLGTTTTDVAAAVRSLAVAVPLTGTYRFTVDAVNAVGRGPASARSAQVTAR